MGQATHRPGRRGAIAVHLAAPVVVLALAGGCAHAPLVTWADDPSAEPGRVCAGIKPLGVLAHDPDDELADAQPGFPSPLARAQALYCLGLYAAALAVLKDDVLAPPKSAAPADAGAPPPVPKPLAADRVPGLRWMVYIHRRFSGWERIVDIVGAVARADLDRPEIADVRDHLHLLAGRFEYEQGRDDKAIELLRTIPPASPLHVQAALLEGAVHVRAAAPNLALAAFNEALRAAPAGRDARLARERDLAILSIARVYYGMQQLDAANRYYDALAAQSAYWVDAALEGAWTKYRLAGKDPVKYQYRRNDAGARARLATLQARSNEVPLETMAEATVLEATIVRQYGRSRDVDRIQREFNVRYVALYQQIVKLRKYEPEALYTIACSVRAGGALPPPLGAQPALVLLSDVPIARRFEELEELKREEARYLALVDPKQIVSPRLLAGGAALASRKQVVEREAGDQIRRRLQRLVERLVVQIKNSIGLEMDRAHDYPEPGELE